MTSAAAPLDLVSRFAAGDRSPEVLNSLQAGFSTWVRADCAVPLERCLRLPNTPGKARRVRRNFWLRTAAGLLREPSDWATAVSVSRELDTFLTRGPWRVWQDLDAPPDGASELRAALFHVGKTNHGRALTARQVNNILGSFFTEKFQSESATITSSQTGETFGD